MNRTRALAGLGVVAAGAGALLAGRARHESTTRRRVEDLLSKAAGPSDRSTTDRDDLPDPVARYLDRVVPADPPPFTAVRVTQRGDLRVGGPDSRWLPFRATHHATVEPPGFVWDASVRVAGPLSVRVLDAFGDGEASASVAVLGAIPLDARAGDPELAEAALQRYLAEAVWYPTALLPGDGLSWEPAGEDAARATLAAGGTTASVTVHVRDDGLVESVRADRRFRSVGDRYEARPWTGTWREYERREGVLVPTAGAATWHLPEGDLPVWRGRVREHACLGAPG